MYPANFLGLGRGLDFLLLLFLHQGKKRRSWGQKDLASREEKKIMKPYLTL